MLLCNGCIFEQGRSNTIWRDNYDNLLYLKQISHLKITLKNQGKKSPHIAALCFGAYLSALCYPGKSPRGMSQ